MPGKIICTLLSVILLSFASQGQQWSVWSGTIEPTSTQDLKVATAHPFNGITLRFTDVFPENMWLLDSHGKSYKVTRDVHVDEWLQSNLIFMDDPAHSFRLISTDGMVAMEFYCQYVAPLSIDFLPVADSSYCYEPATIPQSVWRDGLPEPTPGRFATPTRHCIVHHSATPVSDTNSMALVRSFYIQHTQINGWDDIGYNYLIGHDGTLFAGRDPERSDIAQDNVFGAHFCGKNSYTMGICVIGSFENVMPKQAALDVLTHLLTWKLHKDGMQPMDSLPHPDTLNGPLLPVIAGHRNGCATECPGQQLFDLLIPIRANVAEILTSCTPLAYPSAISNRKMVLYPNPTSQYIAIHAEYPVANNYYRLLSWNGRIVISGNLKGNILDVNHLPAGMYLLHLYTQDGILTDKIMVVR